MLNQLKNKSAGTFLSSWDDLPADIEVCIYGAGSGGLSCKRLLCKNRSDIYVRCFLDDVKTGELEGVPIIKPCDLDEVVFNCAVVLVASAFWKAMEIRLLERGIEEYIIIPLSYLFETHIFQAGELQMYAGSLSRVRRMLGDQEDKVLFDLLIENRQDCKHEKAYELYRYVTARHKQEHREYLEFINKEAIHTIIEGGLFQGKNTITFLDFLHADGRIYGFEPFYEAYCDSLNASILDCDSRVQVDSRALWHKSERVLFQQKNDAGSKIVDSALPRELIKVVDAISIDDFIEEKHISQVDFIKMDIEGAELDALNGALSTLINSRPQLAICIYHRKEHLFEIPLFLNDVLDSYTFRLGHYSSSFWDTVLYAIPNELYTS